MTTVGERIRSLREGRELTQQALADQLGVASTTVYRWEKQGSVPRPSELRRVAAVFGVTVGYLKGVSGEPKANGHWDTFMAKYPHLDELSAEDLEEIRGFARRTGGQVNSWVDYERLAEWVRLRRPRPSP